MTSTNGTAGTRAVVFDLGGVVVRICRNWREGCAAAGLTFRAEAAADAMVEVRRSLSREYQSGAISCEEFFLRVSEQTGRLYDASEVERIHHAWTMDEYTGVLQLVDDLHEAAVPTGILSNTNHSHWVRLLVEYPAIRRVHERHASLVHASHILGHNKPDAEIYRAFETRTGLAGSEIIFFDDLEPNVLAAREAGWDAHQIDHTGDTAAQMRCVLAGAGLLG